MTKLCHFIAAVSLIALAANSCNAAPPAVKAEVAPEATTVTKILRTGPGEIILVIDGLNFYALTGQPATLTTITQVVRLDGPGPTPPPNPGPTPLNARAAKYRSLALATLDPARVAIAQKLSSGYLTIAVVADSYTSPDTMAVAVRDAANSAIPAASVQMWAALRKAISDDWNDLLRLPSTNADFASLLKDVSAGLTASALSQYGKD